MAASREYDIILLGATGYTGKLAAQYLANDVSEPVKWAIAGRSQSKLNELASKLTINKPDIIVVTELTVPEVSKVAKQTRILLNTVGPYCKYSTPIVQACAESATHYLDVTGETPWVREVINKFETTARKNKVVMIPECGVESAPSDLVAYSAVKLLREVWDCGAMDMVASLHELKTAGASGGTLATGLALFERYNSKELREASHPFVLSPLSERDHRHSKYPSHSTYRQTTLEELTGVWKYPLLGTLCPSITAKPNEAIVHRSSGKYPYYYGFNFNYKEHMAVDSALTGYVISIALAVITFMLAFPLTRPFVALFIKYKPGEGPSEEQSKNDRIEWRGVAIAEQLSEIPRKAFVNFVYEGGMYELTAKLLVNAALTLLKEQQAIVKIHGYGFLTPSTLGQGYIDRLNKAGVELKVKQLGQIGSK